MNAPFHPNHFLTFSSSTQPWIQSLVRSFCYFERCQRVVYCTEREVILVSASLDAVKSELETSCYFKCSLHQRRGPYFDMRGRFSSLKVIREPEKNLALHFHCSASQVCQVRNLPSPFSPDSNKTIIGKIPENHLFVFVLGFDKILVA